MFTITCIFLECEQDKATLEMESMEDGYLGKILVGDGAKDIPCGQVYFRLYPLISKTIAPVSYLWMNESSFYIFFF